MAKEADEEKSRNTILIPSNRDRHKSRSSCLAESYLLEQPRKRTSERERGNNFPRSTWLRFIIYDLGNNPAVRNRREWGCA